MSIVTHSDIIIAVSQRTKKSKAQSGLTVAAFVKALTDAFADGDTVCISGLGTFKVVERVERKGRNPNTGEPLHIPACKTVVFKPTRLLKQAVNE